MRMNAKFSLTKKQGNLLEIFLISILMTAVMSLGMILIENDTYNNILQIWGKQFLTGCYIAVPVGFILVPAIRKFVELFIEN